MLKHILLLLLFIGIESSLFSQNIDNNYKPLDKYYPNKEYLNKLCDGYDSILNVLNTTSKKESKSYKEAFKEIKKDIKTINNDSLLMVNDRITNYLQSLVKTIQQKNPAIASHKFSVFTYRTTVPNAYCYGNGIILYNLDLLAKLKSESEVAFILCHEMSHDIEKHTVEAIQKNYEIKNDPEIKKQFNKVKKTEYNQLKSYENYLAKYIQTLTSKIRKNEVEADSLGLVLFCNAGFNIDEAYKSMERLDSIDNELYTDKINYEKAFNSPEFTFKKQWLIAEAEEETIGGGNYKDIKYPDSLKTHPDCKYRLKKMQERALQNKHNALLANDFETIHALAQFEMLQIYIDEYALSKALYNNLHLLKTYPNSVYLKTTLSEILYELYTAKFKHYFSLTVQKPEPKFNNSYLETLMFLNNIGVDDLKKLSVNYYNSYGTAKTENVYTAYVNTLMKSIDATPIKKTELLYEYFSKFGKNNIYYAKLKTEFYKN